MARQGDPEAQAELDSLPPLPVHAAHIWAAFLDLHATRVNTGMGPARLTRAEIHAWEADECRQLGSWERRALMAVDAAWVRVVNENAKAREAKT